MRITKYVIECRAWRGFYSSSCMKRSLSTGVSIATRGKFIQVKALSITLGSSY